MAHVQTRELAYTRRLTDVLAFITSQSGLPAPREAGGVSSMHLPAGNSRSALVKKNTKDRCKDNLIGVG